MTPSISLFNVAPIFANLADGEVFITSNQRLASRIKTAYAAHCINAGRQVVKSPEVYSLSAWLDDCWNTLLIQADPNLLDYQDLSTEQQLLVFEELVERSENIVLMRQAATAELLSNAYDQLLLWGLSLDDSELSAYFSSDDHRLSLQWLKEFDRYCRDGNLLPRYQRIAIIHRAFVENRLQKLPRVYLVGFEQLPPLYESLLRVAAINEPLPLASEQPAAAVQIIACDDLKDEVTQAALWAKTVFKNHCDDGSVPRLAIVIPELSAQREKILRLLQEVFDPNFMIPGLGSEGQVFNISAGRPLFQEPVIQACFQLLSLKQSFSVEGIIRLLHNPFIGLSANDDEALSLLIKALTSLQQRQITPAKLRQLSERVSEKLYKGTDEHWHFSEKLQQLATVFRSISHKQYRAQQWAEYFRQLVFIVGWPGQRNPNSIEFQAIELWQKVLQQFVSVAEIKGDMIYSEALDIFKHLCKRRVFQAKTTESPLQVLGLLEASGLEFDAIWLCSMSEKQWPKTPSPNPMLPFSLQKRLNMPNATAERELFYAEHLTQRFIHSAKKLYVSYPSVVDDSPSAVSHLFSTFKQVSIESVLPRPIASLLPMAEIRRRYKTSLKLTAFSPSNAPPLAADEEVRGGSSIFSNQSACAFKAFANHRLGLLSLPQPIVGLDKAKRGGLLHRSLELIWKQLKTQQALLALNEKELAKLCQDYANFSVNELISKHSQPLGERFLFLEKNRLSSLLVQWLAVEKMRAPFEVCETELLQVFNYKQLRLEGRIDRVDRLSDGRYMIIDYKTSRNAITAWWGDRMDQPQLPLYLSLYENAEREVSAISFANVNPVKFHYTGVGDLNVEDEDIRWRPAVQSASAAKDWPQLKAQWASSLQRLAQAFVNGDSLVDPKDLNKSCQYCDYSSLCRIEHGEVN